jgi:hypothetical protein
MKLRRFSGYTKGILFSEPVAPEEQCTVFVGEDIVALAHDPKDELNACGQLWPWSFQICRTALQKCQISPEGMPLTWAPEHGI